MSTQNYIAGSGSGVAGDVGGSQPTTPGFWMNAGVLTFFNGTENQVIDTDQGPVLDAFGNPTNIDI